MRVIIPTEITDLMLQDSNIPEDDYDSWDGGTTYGLGDRVIAAHMIWESVQADNTNHDPETDLTNTWWVNIGATNRWRAFDHRIGGQVVGGATIEYKLAMARTLNRIALFSMLAESVSITVTAPGNVVIFDEEYDLSTRPTVGNFWEYIYNPFEFRVDVIIEVPLPSGSVLDLVITGGTITKVGEIVLGEDLSVGETISGTNLGIVDYSVKERDEWGGIYIVPRSVTKTVNFIFKIDTNGAARVQQIMERVSNQMAVYYAGAGIDDLGTTIAGILRDYSLTLEPAISEGRLEVESLA